MGSIMRVSTLKPLRRNSSRLTSIKNNYSGQHCIKLVSTLKTSKKRKWPLFFAEFVFKLACDNCAGINQIFTAMNTLFRFAKNDFAKDTLYLPGACQYCYWVYLVQKFNYIEFMLRPISFQKYAALYYCNFFFSYFDCWNNKTAVCRCVCKYHNNRLGVNYLFVWNLPLF